MKDSTGSKNSSPTIGNKEERSSARAGIPLFSSVQRVFAAGAPPALSHHHQTCSAHSSTLRASSSSIDNVTMILVVRASILAAACDMPNKCLPTPSIDAKSGRDGLPRITTPGYDPNAPKRTGLGRAGKRRAPRYYVWEPSNMRRIVTWLLGTTDKLPRFFVCFGKLFLPAKFGLSKHVAAVLLKLA